MIDQEQGGRIVAEMVEIARAFRTANRRSRTRTLTGTKVGALQRVRDGDVRLGELATCLAVSAPVVSRAVESLEEEGMVERRTDSHDARAYLISITDRGRANLAERERYFVERFTTALPDWSSQDAESAIGVLQTLNACLTRVFEDESSNA